MTTTLNLAGVLLPDALSDSDRAKFLALQAVSVRKRLLQMIFDGGSGHPGASMSATDILVSLYYGVLRHQPSNPNWRERDRFVLSKGHACPALYVVLADTGYYSQDELKGFRQVSRMLQGHPEYGTPGVEAPTGSLGQGLSSAVGMAAGFKYQRLPNRVYALIGDGECQEGQVWEAAMTCASEKYDNLTIFLDYNKMQQDGFIADIRNLEPLSDKWRAFGWAVREIDGHNNLEILAAARWAQSVKAAPQVIICHTIKGKGVSFMENVPRWHGTKPPSPEELEKALAELDAVARGLQA